MKTSPSHRALIRRYLVWAYKSTKESFDRLERKTTQLAADEHILARMVGEVPPLGPSDASEYMELMEEFRRYILKKKETPVPQAKYAYLTNRLKAVEAAIVHFLGKRELGKVQAAYEEEFTRRIWSAREEHHA